MDMDESTRSLLYAAILSSGGWLALIVTLLKSKREARKDDATTADLLTKSATRMIEPLKTQIDELQAQVGVLEDRVAHQDEVIHKFVVGTKRLHKQLLDAGMNPVWQPANLEAELK
jgi:hypothetical protein